MSAMGETPERVRVGDFRSNKRKCFSEAGSWASISEFRRKEILWATEILCFRMEMGVLGWRRRMRAASLAARSLSSPGAASFLGENAGSFPVLPRSFAAEFALWADFGSGKMAPQMKRLERSPAMK
jgi:hypothetical protein